MLDLDSLAEKCAKTLNEQQAHWHKAVWSPGFQKISSHMSDGEVEILLGCCKSFVQLEAVVAFLAGHALSMHPYKVLVDEAKTAGLGLSEWIATLPKPKL